MNESRSSHVKQDPATGGPPAVAVLLPLPLAGAYDYAVPEGMSLQPGDLVEVPLGQRLALGVVWGPPQGIEAKRLKAVAQKLEIPPMADAMRQFLTWMASYTMTPPGAVLRLGLSAPEAFEPERPTIALRGGAVPVDLKLTAARKKVLKVAEDGFARSASDLAREAGVGASVVQGLAEAGALERVEIPAPKRPRPDLSLAGPLLSPAQRAAAKDLIAKVGAGFSVTLLDGVTGSGKTEVYFEAVAAALRAGRQVLVLLPEIALSAQWLKRFEMRFGVEPTQWHSEVGGKERRRAWRDVALGDALVVVGARSALFLPFCDLGLIVVDEEHESAFKQEDGVIYHARDMAVARANQEKAPVILVSATPSLETRVNVERGRYGAVHLPERHGKAVMPTIATIDLRRDRPQALPGQGPGYLSPSLRQALADTLAAGEQSLLFLNRRGYAPLTLCRTCGHRLQCPNCSAWLVEHRFTRRLQCHHCGYNQGLPEACPSCNSPASFAACGPGVERVNEEVAALFPGARRAILSSDLLIGPKAIEALVGEIEAQRVDIVIGTQLVAKGHHFPHLTLVGVVDADLGLAGGDLRAGERTFQMLQQVSGRAGREERPGRVLLQTHDPDHPVMRALVTNDREGFLEEEKESRRRYGLPPFGRLIALIVSGPDANELDRFCQRLAKTAPRQDGLSVLGPAPAPLALLRGRHRRRFLVKARAGLMPQELVAQWLAAHPAKGGLRIQIDVDPYSFF